MNIILIGDVVVKDKVKYLWTDQMPQKEKEKRDMTKYHKLLGPSACLHMMGRAWSAHLIVRRN